MEIQKAKWIWQKNADKKDTYCEFSEHFDIGESEKTFLKIACDGIYSAYVNGALVAFSHCSDFPWYKFYDEIDITGYCRKSNELKISVWHLGEDSQTYINASAGVIFEVTAGDTVLAYSNKNTASRIMNEYKNGYCKLMTPQLGNSFFYDNTVEKNPYTASEEVNEKGKLHKRPIKPLVLENRLPVNIIPGKNSILSDMGRETAGFLDIDIESPEEQALTICFGEHIADGCVRRKIWIRDFSVEIKVKKGRNEYINHLRRIAGRYLEIFCDKPIKINYAGIRSVNYPVEVKPVKFGDETLQKIYSVSVDTLRLCMHEHYEDCPWREQALYTLDSRNQMLCGYFAFDGFNAEYVRYNLVLISKSLRSDGLLSICAPSGTDAPIPFFSLVYILQVYEYIRYTNDKSILSEVEETLDTVMNTFAKKADKTGLIPAFKNPCWNFYEWADESSNDMWQNDYKDNDSIRFDLILNCMYVYALGFYGKIKGKEYDAQKIKESIHSTFFKDGVFVLSTETKRYSQLGNALALLIGVGDESLADRIITDADMISATLPMKSFLYDALLLFGDKYKAYILREIKRIYGKMLSEGATSFWETEKGESDFDGAGSLCHGWSAIPVYYLNILDNKT